MIPDVSQALSWLESHPDSIRGIKRGIERETLRVKPDGLLATTRHPMCFGSPLTHQWITTDFAEALLELITPVDDDIDHLLEFLGDLHRHVSRQLGKELMWPMSMPCKMHPNQKIQLAQYGSSYIGQMKTHYRQGLKNRYGASMQIIAGVHYNFSLPLSFWKSWAGVCDAENGKEIISAGYLQMIRNYYRLGWVIPYLFGASPAICSSFMQGQASALPLEYSENGMFFLPHATSLRLSNMGYLNRSPSDLDITFNNFEDYIISLKKAMQTPSKEFAAMGVKDKNGNWIQLNTNILQIENELYIPIRPKRVTRCREAQSDALQRRGIEYVEVRSLDVNPFSPIGVSSEQIRFLDMFLIWCAIADAPKIDSIGLLSIRKNWDVIITEGRKYGQTVHIDCRTTQYPVSKVGKSLLYDLKRIAKILDSLNTNPKYQKVCQDLQKFFEDPDLTYSGRLLPMLKSNGVSNTGLALAWQYKDKLSHESLKVLESHHFINEARRSRISQKELEAADAQSQKFGATDTIYHW
ncbi:Glutamate--cysteine ligase [Candidatus Erwinia haradaeae]|uniref:Glutamate--cysteine ligase n=1 Tax=Candidatus Erwinia haradaeae TaxID=1922217 RepID=A0A451DKK8_9GAMM|nr:glutamate--cysteine ligase [Candidatus Erwinia haradaeae]VFP87189.1 Glutamate--cysteine ligase [Candidatus Erwinia haradaeae]